MSTSVTACETECATSYTADVVWLAAAPRTLKVSAVLFLEMMSLVSFVTTRQMMSSM